MSDGGVDIDERLKNRRNSINLFGFTTDPKTGIKVSFPSIQKTGSSINNYYNNSSKSFPIRKQNSIRNPEKFNLKKNLELISLQKRDKKSINIRNSSSKPLFIQKGRSFSALLNKGWTKEKLMKYFVLSEQEFERNIESLERIHKKGRQQM